jgi:hypothetical protein
LARKLLERSLAGGDELETAYWRAATHAEALLLLGDIKGAKKAFAGAIAQAPEAYEDHASTLRQFGMLLRELGKDASWLDPLRPPRSLHFAGHMALPDPDDRVRQRIRAVLRKERVGFGYGALASGGDILIAEALLDEGAELHLVLPAPKERFCETSAANSGPEWESQCARVLARATSVRSIAGASDPASARATQLSAEVAMGAAVMQANILMTEAVQLVILDKAAPTGRAAGGTAWIGSVWKKTGRRQHTIAAPRFSREAGLAPGRARPALPVSLAAMLRIDLTGADVNQVSEILLPRLAKILAKVRGPLVPPRWTGEAVLVAFPATAPAARAAIAAADALAGETGVRICGHYATVHVADDAFSGKTFLAGPATELLTQVVRSTPSGAIHVTEDFAAALHAGAAAKRLRTEYVGDLPSGEYPDPVRLFSLKP